MHKLLQNQSKDQYNALPHIDDVDEFDEADFECLQEVKRVLEERGKAGRFGVALLHRHFSLNEAEVLVEETDEDTRVQTIRPVNEGDLDGVKLTPTIIRLDTDDVILGCYRVCSYREGYGHRTAHARG